MAVCTSRIFNYFSLIRHCKNSTRSIPNFFFDMQREIESVVSLHEDVIERLEKASPDDVGDIFHAMKSRSVRTRYRQK